MDSRIRESIIQEIQYSSIVNSGVRLFVLRDDLIHPFLNGNKYRKLKFNIPEILSQPESIVITFGGVWSNHLVATAAAGKMYRFDTFGVVRGDEGVSNDALRFVQECGMKIHFLSRQEYRLRHEPEFLISLEESLRSKYPEIFNHRSVYFLPEGGSNAMAIPGCEEIPKSISMPCDYIACACGTGATLAGISRGLKPNQRAVGIAVLKGENFLPEVVKNRGADPERFELIFDFVFGGYAKHNVELLDFCNRFKNETGIPVEPVYSGKLFYGLIQLIRNGHFPSGSIVTAVHTGGIFDFNLPLS